LETRLIRGLETPKKWEVARPGLSCSKAGYRYRKITIQWININKTNHALRWIVIYPVASVNEPLNNWGLKDNTVRKSSGVKQQQQNYIQGHVGVSLTCSTQDVLSNETRL